MTIETCPHYLTLTEDSDIGNLAKINPPVRKQDDQDRIWEGLINGEISTVGTDHCCVCRADKAGSIWDAAAGFPGMATMLPVVLTEGVHKRGMSLQRAAQITSYNSAVAFNMAPRKGTLHVGSDADVAVVDLKLEKVVDPALLGSASDFSLQEGNTLTGWPVLTVLRGKIIVRDGELLGEPGDGEFVRR